MLLEMSNFSKLVERLRNNPDMASLIRLRRWVSAGS
ncbi:MAG: hypothetical protein ACPL07_00085 [Candidatus Bathyarchaeia archaeon]